METTYSRWTRGRNGVWALGVACWLLAGCAGPAPAEAPQESCPAAAAEQSPWPDFLSEQEAVAYFSDLADQAERAAVRYEHALQSLKDDRRWSEPEQRIWLSIATTDTLDAIERNRRLERDAQEQLQLLAAR